MLEKCYTRGIEMAKFKVGDRVEVTDSKSAFSGTLPVGSKATVRAVHPSNMCRPNEVLLDASMIYHFSENLTLISEGDPIADLKVAVEAARAAGFGVECIVREEIVVKNVKETRL